MINAAVIGCGRMGARLSSEIGYIPNGWLPLSHAESLKSVSGINLSSLCDKSNSALDKYSMLYNVRNIYTDYKELIDKELLSILTIATRTPDKKHIIDYALNKNIKCIYVEKPLANSFTDCLKIKEKLLSKNAVLMYGVNRRYHPAYRFAKQLIENQEIGDVVEIIVDFGKSSLMWTHPHSMDLLLYYAGTNNLLSSQAWLDDTSLDIKGNNIISDPLVKHAYFEFESDITGIITQSNGFNVKISGTKGIINILSDGDVLELIQKNSNNSYFNKKTIINEFNLPSASNYAFSCLRDYALNTQNIMPISIDEIITGMAMIFSCVHSHINQNKKVLIKECNNLNYCLHAIYKGLYA